MSTANSTRHKKSYQTSQQLKSLFWIVVVIGIVVLSWIGLAEMYPETNQVRYMPDRVFRILKIVTGNDPVSPVEPYNVPFSLIFVKILLIVLILRALFKLVQSIFFEHFSQLKALLKNKHLIVVGIGDKGKRIIEDYQQRTGKTAVAIEKQAEHRNLNELRREGHTILTGDATQANILRNGHAAHASTLICFIKDEQTSIQIASQLSQLVQNLSAQKSERLAKSNPPIKCLVHLENPRLVSIFKNYSQAFESHNHAGQIVNISFFNLFSMIARRFFYQLPQDLMPILQQPNVHIRFMMWGFDEVSEALLVQGLRIFHLLPTQTSEWRVFCKNAKDTEREFHQKYPKLALITQYTSIKQVQFFENTGDYRELIVQHLADVEMAQSPNSNQPQIYTVGICATAKDKQNLNHGVEILHHSSDGYPAHEFPIYILNSESQDFDRLLTGQAKDRLRFFGDLDDFCKYELITAEKQDALAKAIHEDYLRQIQQDNPTISESQYYQQQWQNLNEDAKDANRTQADHIIYKFILAHKFEQLQNNAAFEFSENEVERLAITEHQRWATHRYLRGWDIAEKRDDVRKLHPSLIGWEQLNEAEKQKDRDTILRLKFLVKNFQDVVL